MADIASLVVFAGAAFFARGDIGIGRRSMYGIVLFMVAGDTPGSGLMNELGDVFSADTGVTAGFSEG